MGNPLAGTYYENGLSKTGDTATVTINEDGSCSIIGTIGMSMASSAYDSTKKTNFNILVKEWLKSDFAYIGYNTSFNNNITIVVNEPAGWEVFTSWNTNNWSSNNGTNVIQHKINISVNYNNDDANYYMESYYIYTTNYN